MFVGTEELLMHREGSCPGFPIRNEFSIDLGNVIIEH